MDMTNTIITLRLVNRLSSDIEPFNLQIKLDNNLAVNQWLDRFIYELESGSMLKKEHIFMSHSPLTVEQMISQINRTLDEISNYDFITNQHPNYPIYAQPEINERLNINDFLEGPNNSKMNLIHNYFPMLAGSAHRTSNYMYAASLRIRIKICRLNLEVHELHTVLQKNNKHDGMHLNISWQRAPNKLESLPIEFDEIFTKFITFGDVLLGYPQVGKTHFEAFIEEDNELDSEHVEPIKLLSGDMLLHLSSDIGQNTIEKFNNWLVEKNLDPNDKTLRLGFAKLGRVINVDPIIVKDKLCEYNDIDQISVGEKVFNFIYSRFDDDYDDIWLKHVDD
jgi:hypothetical protein